MARVHLAGVVRIGTKVFVQIPTLARHLRDGVDAIAQDAPVTLGINRVAWKTAPEADDGDGFILRRRRYGCFHLRAAQKIIRHRLNGGIVEDQSGGKRATRASLQAGAEFERQQGIHPHIEEAPVRLRKPAGELENLRRLALNETNQFVARPRK